MESGLALRAKYPDAHRCACLIDGQPCEPDRVSVRSMNMGQPWRAEVIDEVQFCAELPMDFFLDILRIQLPELIDDCKKIPDPESDLDRALRAADWPQANEVMENPELKHFLAEWFAQDLLLHWFNDGPSQHQSGFVLNTIGGVEVTGNRMQVRGKGRATGTPAPYQDV